MVGAVVGFGVVVFLGRFARTFAACAFFFAVGTAEGLLELLGAAARLGAVGAWVVGEAAAAVGVGFEIGVVDFVETGDWASKGLAVVDPGTYERTPTVPRTVPVMTSNGRFFMAYRLSVVG